MTPAAVWVLASFLSSAVLCGVYLWLARRWQILDIPNERSSHVRPTPKGGGLPLMSAFFIGIVGLLGFTVFGSPLYGPILLGALFLTALGVIDDIRPLSVRIRFFAYGLLCVLVAAAVLRSGGINPGYLLIFCTAFAMLWVLNLFNFMDGTDGLAATACFQACCGAALLAWGSGGSALYSHVCLLLGFSHLGFLLWNWPVARLFMGDAGSIPTGFALAALAVLGAVQGDLNIASWLVLLAVFITDASWTLLTRVITAQNFTQAHRSHAYQRLSRHWNSHQKVLILFIAINGLWLFPVAWGTIVWPQYSISFVILAYLPLLLGMAKIRNIT